MAGRICASLLRRVKDKELVIDHVSNQQDPARSSHVDGRYHHLVVLQVDLAPREHSLHLLVAVVAPLERLLNQRVEEGAQHVGVVHAVLLVPLVDQAPISVDDLLIQSTLPTEQFPQRALTYSVVCLCIVNHYVCVEVATTF